MTKTLLAIAFIMMVGFAANAQRDGFFNQYDGGDRGISNPSQAIQMPSTDLGSHDNSDAAPLGSGLFVLTAFGAGYALAKRKH